MNLRERMKLMKENRDEKYKAKTERLQQKHGLRSERYKVVKEMSESKAEVLSAKSKLLKSKQELTATRVGGVKKAFKTFKKDQPTMTVKRVKGKKRKKGRGQVVERSQPQDQVKQNPFFLGDTDKSKGSSPFTLQNNSGEKKRSPFDL